ncbi:hypothetical protein [Infirmifilum sp. SLHALR2]|nr:MAG: hypothetical protein B7L53_01875 [Thermofilum sp. NZ13]
MASLREEFLKLLEEDREFRYAVAGYLGVLELLKRLDALAEEQEKIWKEIKGIREEIKAIREEQKMLREDFNRAIRALDRRLVRVERTLEKLTVDIEEEARSIIRHRLKAELGLDVELAPLVLPELEVDVYGVSGDVCVVGEVAVRSGLGELRRLLKKLELLKSRYPEKLRPKTILVIYTSLALPELVEEAKAKNVWVLKATQDYYKPDFAKTPGDP